MLIKMRAEPRGIGKEIKTNKRLNSLEIYCKCVT